MSFLSRINPFSRSPLPTEKRQVYAIGWDNAFAGSGNLRQKTYSYDQAARASYILNAVAYRCMKMVCSGAAHIKIDLVEKTMVDGVRRIETIQEHALLDLMNRPTRCEGRIHFFEKMYTYLRLAGNSYIAGYGPNEGQIRELGCLRPDRVTVIPGKFGYPSAYEYKFSDKGDERKRFVVKRNGECPRLLHIREFHPTDDYYGLSRTEPGKFGIERHNESSQHNHAMLQNGARPSGMLSFKPIKGLDGEYEGAPQNIIEEAEKQLRARHQGSENAGQPFVVSGDVDWDPLSMTPIDMDFIRGKEDATRDICAAWGIPPILIVTSNATYNNIKEARQELYEDVILPMVYHVLDEINRWLVPQFSDGRELKFIPDLDTISALEDKRTSKRDATIRLVQEGLLSLEEARIELGYEDHAQDFGGVLARINAPTLLGLIEVAKVAGIEPLRRYLVAMGLVDETVTPEELLSQALDILDDDDSEGSGNNDSGSTE